MQLHSRQFLTTLITAALSLSATPRVLSDIDEGDRDDGERGGHVEGSERLEQKTNLTATADAPAGAKGKARLRAANTDGVSSAILKLEVEGLAIGTYQVTVTSLADPTVATPLGNFEVVAGGGDDGEDDNDDADEDHQRDASAATQNEEDGDDNDGDHSDGTDHDGESDNETSVVFGGASGTPFPDGFNPLDIGGVTIADANNVVLLTGSFDTAATSAFTAKVKVRGGADAPATTGRAAIRAWVKKKELSQRFALTARDLPAKTEVTVTFNGTQQLQARTNSRGVLRVSRLPRGVIGHRVTSVEIEGSQGEQLGSAHF